jgi:hypothetical protein
MNNSENTITPKVNLSICGGNRTLVDFGEVEKVPTPPVSYRNKPNKKTGELAVSHQPIAHDELIILDCFRLITRTGFLLIVVA